MLDEVTQDVNELNEFHEKIFGKISKKIENTEDEKTENGLKQELELRMNALSVFEKEQHQRYKALNEQIDSLLPGATSAGLASAYGEMKKSFSGPIKNATWLFYGMIGLMLLFAFYSTISSIGKWYINFVDFNDWSVVLKSLIYKTPLYGPIIWLAFYASKRRSEAQRLQQEYSHKEALTKSYESFKRQIDILKNSEHEILMKNLLHQTLKTIAFNASITLDNKHGDKMPAQDVIEKIFEVLDKRDKNKTD